VSKRHVLGFDVGGTNVRCALLNEDGEILARARAPMPKAPTIGNTTDTMAGLAAQCEKESGINRQAIACAGIGSPGPLNSRSGWIVHTPNLPWKNEPFAPIVEERLKIKTFLEGDANAAGWGEYWRGAGRNVSSLVMFTLGTGVGGCLILDGRLVRGPDDSGGHLGHTPATPYGAVCGCGAHGCLETIASATAVARRLRDAAARGVGLCGGLPPEKIAVLTARDASAAAEKGCPTAREILAEAGRALGRAAAFLANALNPDVCVVGGGLVSAADKILEPMRIEFLRAALPDAGRRLRIVPAALGDDAGVSGAAGLALARLHEEKK
jgi:glucokinase